jgi:S-adenosylmethionine:tRNA-ribosyltransferase-isomerase (queuine synthetase)
MTCKTKIKPATLEIAKTEKGITIKVLLHPNSENMEIHWTQKKMRELSKN